MRRSAACLLLAVFLFTGFQAEAQQPKKMPQLGFLTLAAKPSPGEEAFLQGLREIGYIDGQTMTIVYRRTAGKV